MIDRVILHGASDDGHNMLREHQVDPYDGQPKPTVTRPMSRLDGIVVREVPEVFFYSHTDEQGLPHYRRQGE